jgi:hypothetical protein
MVRTKSDFARQKCSKAGRARPPPGDHPAWSPFLGPARGPLNIRPLSRVNALRIIGGT